MRLATGSARALTFAALASSWFGCTPPPRTVEAPRVPVAAVDISASPRSTCAVGSDGHVYCWGQDCHGAPRDGNFTYHCSRPKQLPKLEQVAAFAIGESLRADCLAKRDSSLWCGNTREGFSRVPLENASMLVNAGNFACAVQATGRVACWGIGLYGSSRLPNQLSEFTLEPMTIRGPREVKQLVAQTGRACAVDATGTTWCWNGQLAPDDEVPEQSVGASRALALAPIHDYIDLGWSDVPRAIRQRRDPFGAIRAPEGRREGGHACALNVEGTPHCWGGKNRAFEMGTERTPWPAVSSFSLGLEHSCALSPDGQAFCWGGNGVGQLGRNTRGVARPRPAPVRTDARFEELVSGYLHTCGRTALGEVWCWGANGQGEVGKGMASPSEMTPWRLPEFQAGVR